MLFLFQKTARRAERQETTTTITSNERDSKMQDWSQSVVNTLLLYLFNLVSKKAMWAVTRLLLLLLLRLLLLLLLFRRRRLRDDRNSDLIAGVDHCLAR